MAILRIAAAAGLLLVLAPEQTMDTARAMLGMAKAVKDEHMPSADAAMAYCKANPAVCADIARNAANLSQPGSAPIKSPKP
jgi:hypothetical protein